MRKINLYDAYELGAELHPLTTLAGDPTITDAFFPLWSAERALGRVLAGDTVPLDISRHAAEMLHEAIKRIFEKHINSKPTGEDWTTRKIPNWEMHPVRQGVEKFEYVLAEELRGTATYFVPQRGIFETADLVDTADNHIPDELRSHVKAEAVEDFRAAGKCLAFALPTACGFHVLRAVEGVLDDYYRFFAGPTAKQMKSWKDYVDALNKIREGSGSPKPDEKTIRNLDQIRDLDRNRLMHPRDTLSMTDALVLFNVATSAIMSMTAELHAAKGQPPLLLTGTASDD